MPNNPKVIYTESFQMHYGPTDPKCPICHGTGELPQMPQLACECRMNSMTVDKPTKHAITTVITPLRNGGARIQMAPAPQYLFKECHNCSPITPVMAVLTEIPGKGVGLFRNPGKGLYLCPNCGKEV